MLLCCCVCQFGLVSNEKFWNAQRRNEDGSSRSNCLVCLKMEAEGFVVKWGLWTVEGFWSCDMSVIVCDGCLKEKRERSPF